MKWTYFLIYTVLLSSTLVVSHAQGSSGRVLYNISFINGSECIGGQKVGLTDTSIKLEYREVVNCDCEVDDSVRKWIYIATITPEERNGNRSINISCPEAVQGIQLRLLQLEHGGGGCNCWEVEEFELVNGSGWVIPLMEDENTTCARRGQNNTWMFCDGLANVERGVITRLVHLTQNPSIEETCPPGDNATDLISPLGPSPTNCSDIFPRIDIALSWDINRIKCPTVEGKDEGVEIAVRAVNSTDEDDGDGSWIPLKIFYNGQTNLSENCKGLDSTTERVRGYDVPTVECSNRFTDITLSVCGDNLMRADALQFRWMGSIFLRNGSSRFWTVDSIRLNLREADKNTTLLSDDFNGNCAHCNLNSALWMEPRGGRNDSKCFPSLSGSPARYFIFGDRTGRVYPPNTVFTGILPTQLIPLHITFNNSGIQVTDSPPTSESCPSSRSTGPTTTTLSATSTTATTRTTPITPTTATTPTTPTTLTTDIIPTPTTTAITPTTPTTLTTDIIPTPTTTAITPTTPTTLTTDIIPTPTTTAITPTTPTTLTTATTPITPITTITPTTPTTPTTDIIPIPTPTVEQNGIGNTIFTIQQTIRNDRALQAINRSDPLSAISLLLMYTEFLNVSRTTASVYSLGVILNRFNSNSTGANGSFILNFTRVIEQIVRGGRETNETQGVSGSTLLWTVDQFALSVLPNDFQVNFKDLVIQTRLLQPTNDTVTTIDSRNYSVSSELMSIQVPAELIQLYANTSDNARVGGVKAISAIYQNVDNFSFPVSRPENNDLGLASGIISTALQCGNELCPTNNVNLTSPVVITIEHSEEIKMMNRSAGNNLTTVCVFWNFSVIERYRDGTITSGEWSDEGCETLSNVSATVCKCNHLTHFAILLSPRPLNISQPVTLSLQIIGYVGVSISLVSMVMTIITFLIFKSLRNMRNIIHINLCISLGIAQLIFVIGVNRSDPTSERVPIHCQVIAVLLHYFFLVSFMWMLMEGVILYLVLVKVFIKRKKCYLLVFSLVSYSAPLLYMGLLTLPLGFALPPPMQPNYGYRAACFLNPGTNFMWAFIVPVIVLILINSALFIRVATIMWKHQKRRTDKTKIQNLKNWLRAAISLVVVMGLTWIMGVLIIEVEALLPLAYIYTIMVAFQGFFIFLIFVVFSKQVRDAYSKWWKVKVNESDFLSRHFNKKSNYGKTRSTKMDVSNSANGLTTPYSKGNHISTDDTADKAYNLTVGEIDDEQKSCSPANITDDKDNSVVFSNNLSSSVGTSQLGVTYSETTLTSDGSEENTNNSFLLSTFTTTFNQ